MYCPECHSLNETGIGHCPTCGLLLAAALPKRRSEDLAIQKRRASDQLMSRCPFCDAEIPEAAIRCRFCSEIVNEEYYRIRSKRIRSRVNYASWVAYLFGLAALLVFRPVGVLSIAAGLLLSIAYYAIPVDPPPSPGKKRRTTLGTLIRKQLKLERVAISIPGIRHKKLVFVGTPLVAALIGYSMNLFLLQEPANAALRENAAFEGMKVSAHYQYWIVPGVVVYDLRSLTVEHAPIDVHTAFLEFAKSLREKRFSRVDLSYKGVTKFSMDGASFRQVGEEYAKRNFGYVLYRVPRLVRAEEGAVAPSANASDQEALLQFHRAWYGQDQFTQSLGK